MHPDNFPGQKLGIFSTIAPHSPASGKLRMGHSKRHIDFLDQIRGIAIIGVFLFHCLDTSFGHSQLSWGSWIQDFNVPKSFLLLLPLTLGWAGVSIFFVVSGFCIHLSFARNPNWRTFGIRRFFRIYPPYFVAVLLFALLVPWTRIPYDRFGLAQLGTHLALIHNYDPHFFVGINGSFWSLAVEAQLYLLYPVLLSLVARLGWNRSLIYIAALEIGLRTLSSVILCTASEPLPLLLTGLPFSYWYSWSIGAAVADAHLRGRPIPFANHSLLVWSGLAICSNFLKPFAHFSFLLFAISTATAIARLLRREHMSIRLPAFFPKSLNKSLNAVGLWSYSIYLIHAPFLVLVPWIARKFFGLHHSQSLVIFALCLCFWFPIIGLSALWYRAFELPSIALSRQIK